MATEDLAGQFDFMNDVDQTPADFGLRVASHPSLEITSKNKLKTGLEVKETSAASLARHAFSILTVPNMTAILQQLRICCIP